MSQMLPERNVATHKNGSKYHTDTSTQLASIFVVTSCNFIIKKMQACKCKMCVQFYVHLHVHVHFHVHCRCHQLNAAGISVPTVKCL